MRALPTASFLGLSLLFAAASPASAGEVDRLRLADGAEMSYVARGAGEPALVFVHCGNCRREIWDETLAAFAGEHRVVAMDLVGYGRSPAAPRERFSIEGYGEDVAALVEHLGLGRVVLVGNSLGGPVALEAARRLGQQRVLGVVAVDTLQNVEAEWPEEDWRRRLEAYRRDFPAACHEMMLGLLPADAPAAARLRIDRETCDGDPRAAIGLFETLRGYDDAAALRAAGVPVVAINSKLYPTAVETNRKHSASFDVVLMDGVGHYPQVERPAEFQRHLRESVHRLAATPTVASAPEPGVRFVPVTTPKGTFRVWTRKVGEHPGVKVLVLHGGPGASHSYLLALERPLVDAGFEVYFYDQLGGGASERPSEPELWEVPRFVDEVEQVRQALGLGRDNFYLYGHSWGGMLAIEYALAHPEHLAGLVISNMMSSAPAYDAYAEQVLAPRMDPAVLAEIRRLEAAGEYEDPRYMELLVPNYYERHLLRRPAAEWPAEVRRSFEQINPEIYVPLQGPSELGISGRLERWDRSGDLGRIAVPTLVLGARHDTMDPAHMEWMAKQLAAGRYHFCPQGSHLAMWDDADCYFAGLLAFLRDAEAGKL